MAKKAVFLDRDGTMAKDVHYCRRPEDFELFPATAKAIKFLNERCFKVIIITNQSGIARGYFTEETLAEIHEKMKGDLAREGAYVDAIYYCPHHPDDNCDCRKPKPKLILQATKDFDIDLKHSFMVGDLQADIDLGKAAGCKTILISDSPSLDSKKMGADAIARDLSDVARIITNDAGKEQSEILRQR